MNKRNQQKPGPEAAGCGPAAKAPPRREPRLVVGIGASAGGLEAYGTFLKNMPADSGMAFVLVQHLLPSQTSMVAELLARHTAMPVQEADDGMPVEPDQVYVIRPNASLGIERGRLRLIVPLERHEHQTVIDRFFTSLAEDQGDRAVCIILTGAGREGTVGVKAVKEHGGLTIAQTVETAAHPSMPGSAAAAGFVDMTLDIERMPQMLLGYAANLVRIAAPEDASPVEVKAVDYLARIHELLREHKGHDFSEYKSSAVVRRIRRRMQVLQLNDVAAYVERLEVDSRERDLLFHDLLIGVTRFFRDPEAFAALERTVIPSILEDKGSSGRVRIWVPGCASGEEAYSIGILIMERLRAQASAPQVQIFATDIDEGALAIARAGQYPAAALADMSPEHIARYFVQDRGLYRVAKGLREMCMFAVQNLTADPPFSRIDLISCRNVLIYLEPELQARLLPLFHYALREDGFLLLGPAENIGRHGRLFTPVDRKQRIFRWRFARNSFRPTFPVDAATRRGRDLQPQGPAKAQELSPAHWAQSLVLEHHAPPYLVVDEHFDVVQFSPRLSRFLDPAAGSASLNVFNLVHQSLRLDLRAALQKASQTQAPVRLEAIRFRHDGESRLVDLIVELGASGKRTAKLFVVVFLERPAAAKRGRRSPAAAERASTEELEHELRATRERLETTIEQLETSNEELASTNEELLSMNEELQSSNEELEASQEELQSLNEELETINTQLREKVEELDRTQDDLVNLLESTAIAPLFLDADLRVKRFTPGLAEVIALQPGDEGRSLGDFAFRFDHPGLLDEIRAAMREGAARQLEIVRHGDGRVYTLRITPYRTTDRVTAGATLAFVDITRIKRAERQLRTYQKRAEVAIAAIGGGLYEHGVPPGTDTYYNERWAEILGYASDELPGSHAFLDWLFERIHPEDRTSLEQAYQAFLRGELERYDIEARLRHSSGRWVWVHGLAQPLEWDERGRVTRIAGLMFDVTADHETRMARPALPDG